MALKECARVEDAARIAAALAAAATVARFISCRNTHSLTALTDACHALCRTVALFANLMLSKSEPEKVAEATGTARENRLENTFGWSRVPVLAALVSRVLFASFSLTLVIESLQVCLHSTHAPPPEAPMLLLATGVIGIISYALGYLLLAGHEESGVPIAIVHYPSDVASGALVMTAGLAVYLEYHVRYFDAALAVLDCVLLTFFSYRYMVNAGLVLAQAAPGARWSHEAAELRAAALRVAGVRALHELHAWKHTNQYHVITAHVVYDSVQDYKTGASLVADVFRRRGYSHITLQPEFAEQNEAHSESSVETNQENEIETSNIDWCSSTCARSCVARRCCMGPKKVKPLLPPLAV